MSRQWSRVPSSDYRHLKGQTHESLKFSKKKVMIFVRSLVISLKPDSYFLKVLFIFKIKGVLIVCIYWSFESLPLKKIAIEHRLGTMVM